MQRIKKGDSVVVTAGKDKGLRGEVLAVYPSAEKVLVRGANLVTKHTKPSQTNPEGGRSRKEAPLHLSNVMAADPTTGRPTRVRVKTLADGKRVRVAVRSGEQIDT